MSLSLADIKRADVQSFRDVAAGLEKMAAANTDMKSDIARLPIAGDAWKGVSGDAAHHELDGFGKLLAGRAESQKGAAAKIRGAADEFEGVKQLLAKIEQDAAKGKFKIDMSTGNVTPPSGDYDKSELDYITSTLKQIQAAGEAANTDLATAVKAAKELPAPSSPAGAALPTTPTSTVKPGSAFGGVQNLATADPDGDPGATKAAAADTHANYKEWYPKTAAPEGDKITMDPSKAGTLTGSLGAMEKNRPPDTPYKPAFGEGVGKRIAAGVNGRVDGLIDEVKNLTGQGGPGSPGVAESWLKAGMGFTDQIANPLKSLPSDIDTAVHDPGRLVGEKLFDVGSVAAGGPIGGEATAGARGLLDSIAGNEGRALTHNLDDGIAGHHTPPPAVDHPSPVGDHHAPAADSWSGHNVLDSSGQLSSDVRDHILSIEKGGRPDPSDYLPRDYIDRHLAPFSDGASRFMPENNLDKYGIAQRDGTSFVMPKGEADSLIGSTHGNPRSMERALGLPEGYLDSNKLVRVNIPDPGKYELRIPSGNEAGANDQWIPGGKLPDGASEAIIDGGRIPNGGYNVTEIPNEGGHR